MKRSRPSSVEEYAIVYDVPTFSVFMRAWVYYHGAPTLTETRSLRKDYALWQSTKAVPKYVETFLTE